MSAIPIAVAVLIALVISSGPQDAAEPEQALVLVTGTPVHVLAHGPATEFVLPPFGVHPVLGTGRGALGPMVRLDLSADADGGPESGWVAADAVRLGPVGPWSAMRETDGPRAVLVHGAGAASERLSEAGRTAYDSPAAGTAVGVAAAHRPYYVLAEDAASGALLVASAPRFDPALSRTTVVGWIRPGSGVSEWDRRGLRLRVRGIDPVVLDADPDGGRPVASLEPSASYYPLVGCLPLLGQVDRPTGSVAWGVLYAALDDSEPDQRDLAAAPVDPDGPLDVVFLVDASRSMEPVRAFAHRAIGAVIRRFFDDHGLVARSRPVHFGIAWYADVVRSDAAGLRSPLVHTVPLSADAESVLTALDAPPRTIATLDPSEAVHAAIASAVRQFQWRPGSARLIVVNGDAGDRQLLDDIVRAIDGDPGSVASATRTAARRIHAARRARPADPNLIVNLHELLAQLEASARGDRAVYYVCGLHARDERIAAPSTFNLADHRTVRADWAPPQALTRFSEQLLALSGATGGELWYTPEYLPWCRDARRTVGADLARVSRPIATFLADLTPQRRAPTRHALAALALLRRVAAHELEAALGHEPLPAVPSATTAVAPVGSGLGWIDSDAVAGDEYQLVERCELEFTSTALVALRDALTADSATELGTRLGAVYDSLGVEGSEPGRARSPRAVLRALGLPATHQQLRRRGEAFHDAADREAIVADLQALIDELERQRRSSSADDAVWIRANLGP